ncbi:MAG: S53 family peptidase [Streptosporangiaceae bacterium]|jgi:subtilase family serine protease
MRLTYGAVALATAAVAVAAALPAATAAVQVAAKTQAAASKQATSAQAANRQAAAGELLPEVATAPRITGGWEAPTTIADCVQSAKVRCYSPLQYQVAYDLGPLYAEGITGKGETIAIIESFGSPTIRHDLTVFDKQWNLPNPVLNILTAGKIPAFNAKNPEMISWAQETSLDVEYAHALAPGATIDLVETPVPETEGLEGFPAIVRAEQVLINLDKVDVISQSFGATEDTLPGFGSGDFSALADMRTAFTDAAAHHVTVLAASGDTGATAPGPDGVTLLKQRAVSWPASDPLVTAVGGTQLTLSQSGSRTAPDAVWNDGYGASGGGQSQIFSAPLFQSGVESVTGDHRGVPDIAMSAAVNGAAWTYGSYAGTKDAWQLFGGTSEATPLFAGIVALADQVAGHPLGDINSALYALGEQDDPARTGIIPVTKGDNSYSGVSGYRAGSGYTLTDGWGTVDAAVFVPALAHYTPVQAVLLRAVSG